MSVTQKKDGRWAVVYYEAGRQRWQYFGRGDDARAAAIDFNLSLGLGKRRRHGPSFGDLVVDWLRFKKDQIAETTWRFSARKFDKVILPDLGNKPAISITAAVIDPWVAKRLKTVKATTVHRDLSDIVAVLNFAVSRGKLTVNPLAGYKKPTRDDAVIPPPSVEEINAILKESPEHLKRAILISYFTGLRPGQAELFRLRFRDIDLTWAVITIESAKKGGLRSREIPLHPEFKKAVLGWIQADGVDPDRHLITYHGKPVRSVKTAWASAKSAAGITRRLRLYDLRHGFATQLLAAGVDIKSVSLAIGHRDAATTLRFYSHVMDDVLRDGIGNLPALANVSNISQKRKKIVKLKQHVKTKKKRSQR